MPDETTEDELRIAHRRGHDKLMHVRAREDLSRADTLVTANHAVLEVGDLFDGEMLVVDGDQVISVPISGGGGGGVPPGGIAHQALFKVDGTDYNTSWRTPDISADVAGLGGGMATFLGAPSSANLRATLTDETGTGAAVFQNGDLGTPSAANLANATNLPASSVVWSGAAVQSPVLPADVLMIEQATGSAKRRVTAIDVSKSSISYDGFSTGVSAIGPTPVNVFTSSPLLPGTYILYSTVAFGVGATSASRVFTLDLAVASGTVGTVSGMAAKMGHTATIGQQGSLAIASLPHSLNTTFAALNQNCSMVYSVSIEVLTTAVITLNASLATESLGFVRPGSFFRLSR